MRLLDANPLLLAATVAIVAGAVAFIVTSAIRRALFGRESLQPPRCAACRSLVRGDGVAFPTKCSECGRATDAPGALEWTRKPRRTIARTAIGSVMSIVAVVLIIGAVAACALTLASGHRTMSATGAQTVTPKPTVDQIASVLIGAPNASEFAAIVGPVISNPQSIDRDTARELLAILARVDFTSSDGAPVSTGLLARLGIRAFADPAGADERLRQQLGAALPQASCLMTPRVQPGGDVVVALTHQTAANESWMKVLAVRVNGAEQLLTRTGELGNFQPVIAASFVAPSAPGTYDVEIDWWADWPLREGADESEPGLAPQRETTRRTLVVTNGPERLEPLPDPSSIDMTKLIQAPHVIIKRNGERAAIWLCFPNVPARMEGTWSIEINGAWSPLLSADPMGSPFDVLCCSFVPTPREFADTMRVRFEPSSAPVVAAPNPPSGGVNAVRALEHAWSKPFECTLKRFAWPYPKEAAYRLESVTQK